MGKLTKEEAAKQIHYRDARSGQYYDDIWKSVGKCAFCDLREKYIFFEENGVVMTISLYAYIDGHFMIIPRRHVVTAKELTQVEWETIRKFSYLAKKMIKSVHGIRGMQLIQKDGAGSQSTVNHLHFHCIPFDAPDLCEWNYRDLKHTPLENVELYKQARKKLISYDQKFAKKYANSSALPLICDVLVVNDKNELLLQERKPEFKLSPDYLTPPGGHVEDFSVTLEEELAREVKEETGLIIPAKDLVLLSSQVSSYNRVNFSKHLKAKYVLPKQFIWNTYVYRLKGQTPKLVPGDDCVALLWQPLAKAASNKRVSDGIHDAIKRAQAKGLITNQP